MRPRHQLPQISRRKTTDIDNCDPVITTAISCWLHARNVSEFDKAIRCHFDAEAPALGFAGLEVGEVYFVQRVDEDVVGVGQSPLVGAWQDPTEFL